jgi:hypothetical protein
MTVAMVTCTIKSTVTAYVIVLHMRMYKLQGRSECLGFRSGLLEDLRGCTSHKRSAKFKDTAVVYMGIRKVEKNK